MKKSERFDRKRRRPKPGNQGLSKAIFLQPWFLKWLIVDVTPVAVKIVELVSKAIDLIKHFWN
jgi:hypothetical protein